ncbi:MAG: hypothetical protein H0T99_00630 [Geodermatophilaceae bacterium]|nr:hypothetical protein [Geodermatophilaceae bacterium]
MLNSGLQISRHAVPLHLLLRPSSATGQNGGGLSAAFVGDMVVLAADLAVVGFGGSRAVAEIVGSGVGSGWFG